jgi:enoyl-CoA hydratase
LNPKSARDFLTLIHNASNALKMVPVPVIARINGYCLGAGPEVAAACDMRISTEDATFGMPEVKVGIPSVVEAALLPKLIGWGKTRVLCYTGENITAEEALNWGLVEKTVSRNKLDEAVEEWINAILDAGPKAIRLQKELIGYWEKMSVSDGIQEGIRSIGNAYETDEPIRMLTAHINKIRKR